MIQSRRGFITGLAALIAAPAIVKAGSLMPVKPVLILPEYSGPFTAQLDVAHGTLKLGDVVRIKLPLDFFVVEEVGKITENYKLFVVTSDRGTLYPKPLFPVKDFELFENRQ